MSDRTVQDVKDQLLASPKKILKKTLARNWHSTSQSAAKKSDTAPISCVRSPRVASNGFGETCTILFMVPTFNWGTSGDFGHYVV
jgi:hypothetical protein